MNPVDYVIIAVIALILGLSGWFIRKSRKSGKKCIGCPDGCSCSSKNGKSGCGSCNGCGSHKGE